MAQITFRGSPVQTSGSLPAVGSKIPAFTLTRADLSDAVLADFAGKRLILNIFPSIDTGVCATSVRKFNAEAGAAEDTVVLCISRDLPFALNRFCGAEGLSHVVSLSDFRTGAFGREFGCAMIDGKLAGLLSRAVVVVGSDGVVRYAEQVPEIAQEPDYAAALAAR